MTMANYYHKELQTPEYQKMKEKIDRIEEKLFGKKKC
jgi:hypothetical protein